MLRLFLTRIKGVPCVPLSLEIGNTLSQILVSYAIGCMFVFPRLGMLREVKRVVTFPKIYRVDPGSSIKVLASKIKKSVFPKYHCRVCYRLCRVKTHQLGQLRRLHRTNVFESSNKKILVNISHYSCTCDGDHLDL